MTLIYHGTSLEKGISILWRGAILSPFQKKMESLEKSDPDLSVFEREKIAMQLMNVMYNPREIYHRAFCLSVVLNDLALAKGYAINWDELSDRDGGINGGLAFGIEVSESFLRQYTKDITPGGICFIEGSLSLSALKEVYVTPLARSFLSGIQREFSKYGFHPTFDVS